MVAIIGRMQLLKEPSLLFLPEWTEAAAREIIGERRRDRDYWWGTRDGWLQLILTRLQQETTTGVDMHFSVRTGPLMNTNSQLAEDEGTGTEEQLEKYESVPCGKERQWEEAAGLGNEVVCMWARMRVCECVCVRVSLKGACKDM